MGALLNRRPAWSLNSKETDPVFLASRKNFSHSVPQFEGQYMVQARVHRLCGVDTGEPSAAFEVRGLTREHEGDGSEVREDRSQHLGRAMRLFAAFRLN